MTKDHTFGPVYDKSSRLLILGSFPSEKSRAQGFYYGHERNRFWPLLAALCNEPVPVSLDEKNELLLSNGIALWDVVQSCDISGSADSTIKNVTPTDLDTILSCADIGLIALNGAKAYSLFERYHSDIRDISHIKLPSTSPANAACSMDRLYEEWSIIRPYIKKVHRPATSFEAVYEIVRKIPRGKVTTYGRIAARLGNVRLSRVVGYALHANPDEENIPCYRVVNKEGRVSDAFVFGGKNEQIELLRADNIPVSDDGYVLDLEKYLW